ncbi:MAG: hypothetical protein ACXVRW_10500 [Solirubrobacteraceae bacterium]
MSGTTIASGAMRRGLGGLGCALALALAAFSGSAMAAAPGAAPPSGQAPGGPGAQSYLDVARKDCFGTARNTTSKVWFTVAGGVLSDVFSPSIEASNVNTVQYIVTDGRSFADLQQRDMTYTVSSPDPSGMVCRVTSTDRAHGFRLVSDYITDPARASVVVHTVLQPLAGHASAGSHLKVYVRYDATIDNRGGGGQTNGGANDATVDPSSTALVASDTTAPSGPFAAQVVGALAADRPFSAESSGFAGTPSDGLSQLDAHHRLVNQYRSATDGNVVQTALIATAPGRPFTLALGFAPTAGGAVAAATQSAGQSFDRTLAQYEAGWHAYDSSLRRPPAGLSGFSAPQNAGCRARTGCRPTSSRQPRTRPTPGRSWPLRPIRGASPCRRPPPTRAGRTARCSRATATRRSRDCSPTAIAPARATWSCSCSTRPSSPTAASPATRSWTAPSRLTPSDCRRSTRSAIRC